MLTIRQCTATVAAAVVLAGAGTTAVAAPLHDTRTAQPAAPVVTPSHFDDGSFETPRVAANTFQDFTTGQSIGPWQVTSGTVDLIGAGYWQAAEGDQSVDLNGTNTGAVAQTFSTDSGKCYTVTYALAGNPAASPTVKTGEALIDGQDFQDFSFDVTGKTFANMGYVYRQFTFIATNASTTVTFASTTPNSDAGPVIDDVRIQPCCSCSSCG
ncbi:choice-of-anchor C family protein [Kitasatospora sp. NPDC052896]|uniref:choice-of-anchor C family protein n=1 Tax=Kitasatospora sp. NPDC052896 TaxID=3364061 RepID=UPI0037C9635F